MFIGEYLILIVLAWVVLELYLLWVNYRGRFKYGLLERSEKKRRLQSRIGVLALPVGSLIRLLLTLVVSLVLRFVFDLSLEVAFALGFSALVGFVTLNAAIDAKSIQAFERYCLKCKHKNECHGFLAKNCQMEFFPHRVKMAVRLTQKRKNSI